MRCLIEQSVTTAAFSHPIRQGWLDDGHEKQFELVAGLAPETVAQQGLPALIGSIEAVSLLDRYVVVTDVALVSWHTGAIALWTPTRPDEIDNVPVFLDGISRTAEALARATIHHFYGINVTGWTREGEPGDAVVSEGGPALRPAERGHLGDLVRAWYILSSLPLPTHLLVAPKDLTEQDPDGVARLVQQLQAIAVTADERRRELRRDLAAEYGVDRERLLEFQTDQTRTLSKTARKGWLDLARRTARQLKLPDGAGAEFVTVGGERE